MELFNTDSRSPGRQFATGWTSRLLGIQRSNYNLIRFNNKSTEFSAIEAKARSLTQIMTTTLPFSLFERNKAWATLPWNRLKYVDRLLTKTGPDNSRSWHCWSCRPFLSRHSSPNQPGISPKQTDPQGDQQQLLLVQAHRCWVWADPHSPKHNCEAIQIDFRDGRTTRSWE